MATHRAYFQLSILLVLTSVALFTTAVSGQSPAIKPNSTGKGIAAAQELRLGNPENKVAVDDPSQKTCRAKSTP